MRPHRALAASLARLLRACRAEVDIERTVPEFIRVAPSGAVQDAVLDLVVSVLGSVQPLYIDVPVRCPRAQRCGQAVASPGRTLPLQTSATALRCGSDVLRAALETYGRLAGDTRRALDHIATHAAACLRDHSAALRFAPRRRACLERALNFSAADVELLAFGCAPTASEARVLHGRVASAQ